MRDNWDRTVERILAGQDAVIDDLQAKNAVLLARVAYLEGHLADLLKWPR